MKSLSTLLVSICLFGSLQAAADETPVFVSCYADDGAHLQLVFDTAQSQFSYRYAKDTYVDEFEAVPKGAYGSSSSVTKLITETHIELKAQIIGGDAEQPVIDTSVAVVFDRDNTGSLKLTSYSFYHLSQPYNLDTFKVGSCYVQ